MSSESVREALPRLLPYINKSITESVELQDTLWAMASKGTPKEMNSLGARQNFKLRVNSNWGNNSSGSYFREPGKGNVKQAVIGFTYWNIAHGATGDYFDNVEGDHAIGGKLAELMADDVAYNKKQLDIDFCHGNGQGIRGTVASISGTTIVIFTAEEGTRFVDPGETYFFHHPTTFAQHGATVGHVAASVDSSTQATFGGDITDNTDVATNDIMVHKGQADGVSSVNRAIYGLEFFFLDSGAYFGLDKDTEPGLRGLRVSGGSNLISLSIVEKAATKWFYRWNSAMPTNMIYAMPPAQVQAYKLLGYNSMRREDGSNFDGQIQKITINGQPIEVDANIRPTNVFIYKGSCIQRYEFKPFGIWRRDGLEMRTVYGNGSNKDEVYWIMDGKGQMFCDNPAEGIQIYSLSTTGLETGV
jgi:hypothetical protein